MAQTLTAETASTYTTNFFSAQGYDTSTVHITRVEHRDDAYEGDVYDVYFEVSGDASVMTVWQQEDGQLYGEW